LKKIRFELILELKALAEQAQQKAIDTHPSKVETKQNWSRLAAYISQVINGIGKTYDEAKINAELDELENLIKEVKEKKQQNLTQQQTAGMPK
jgi:Spy/CpxP family protein refolding chaperone